MKPARDLGDIVFGLRKRAKELWGSMPAVAREFRAIADDVELAVIFGETDRPTGPWNAVAVRQALRELVAYWDEEREGRGDAGRLAALQEAARKALDAPPRNCDVYGFADYEKARRAFLRACAWEGEMGCGECRYQAYDCFEAWLMDLAWPGAEGDGGDEGDAGDEGEGEEENLEGEKNEKGEDGHE